MFQSFTIKNFRCFRELNFGSDQKPLGRINLIAGKNNTGKTALLEGLFLHLGPNNPALPMSLNPHRGIEQLDLGDAEEMWGWLFFRKQLDDVIELISRRDDSRECTLKIRLAELEGEMIVAPTSGATKPTALSGSLTTGGRARELILDYLDSAGPTGITRVGLTGVGFKVKQTQLGPFPLGVFLSTHLRMPKEDAERFSKLEQVGRESEVAATLQILEPRLKRLAVLVSGGTPIIHGDLGMGRLVPVPFMGEGMVRLLSIVLAIASAKGGTILVDEIETAVTTRC